MGSQLAEAYIANLARSFAPTVRWAYSFAGQEAEDAVADAMCIMVEQDLPVRFIQTIAHRRYVEGVRQSVLQDNWLQDAGLTQGEGETLLVPIDRCRRNPRTSVVGFGRGRLLPTVPCEWCGEPMKPRIRKKGQRVRTCSPSCSAQLRQSESALPPDEHAARKRERDRVNARRRRAKKKEAA